MARLATVDTVPQRRRNVPMTHDHARGWGAGRPIPEKRLYGPPMRPESADLAAPARSISAVGL